MSINFSVRWADNTAELKRNLASGLDQIDVTRAAVDKLANSLSGTNVQKSANNWAAALQKVGGEAGALAGIQKLTTAEIDRAIGVFDRAISKAEAMGKGNTALVQTYREMSTALHKASDEAEAASQTHKTFGATVEGLGVSFTKLVAAQLTAQAILGTIEGGFRALAGGISASVKAASDAEHAHTQITAALKAQGNAVPSVVKAYLDYADALQKTTIFQDDAIEGSESLLVQVGNVMPRDMKKALTATTELASGLGKDLNEAAMLVAKAAEGNTTALRKAGVVIDETTAKSGDFGKVLDAITAKFGGQAAAIAGTYEGRLIQLGNTWNNVEESIGRVITQNATVLRLFDVLNQRIADNTGELKDNAAATNLVSDAVILTVRGVALLADAIDFAQTGATAFFIGLRRGGQAIGDIGILALEAAKGFALMQGNMSAFSAANEGISSLRAAVNDLGERNQAATNRSVAFGQALDTIKQRAGELATDLEKTRGKTVELSTATDTGTDAWNKHTKAVIQAGGAQDKFAAAMAELASVGQDWQATIDTIDGSIVEAIKFYLEAGISQDTLATAYALTGAQLKAVDLKLKDHTEALKIADDIAKKFTEQGNKNWKEWQASTKKALDETNKLVVSTFEGFVKAQRDYRDAVAQDTLSADDLARHKLQDQLDDAKVKLRELGESFRSTYDLIEKTIEIKLSEIGTLWKEHPMIPPQATFDAKQQIANIGSVLGSLARDFNTLAQDSSGALSHIAASAALLTNGLQQVVKAQRDVAAARAAHDSGASAAGYISEAVSVLTLAKAWYDYWAAVGADQLADKNIQDNLNLNKKLAAQFHSTTLFSDALSRSIANVNTTINGTTGSFEAAGLHINDIVKELGGWAALTKAQLKDVQNAIDSVSVEQKLPGGTVLKGGIEQGLFAIIKNAGKGSTIAAQATEQLDQALAGIGTTAVATGGLVDKFFLDETAKAKRLGIELKQTAEFMSGQATSAETGIVGALTATNDAWAKRKTLQDQVSQATTDLSGKSGSALADQQAKLADLNAQLLTQQHIIDATGIHSQAAAGAVSGALLGVIGSQVAAGTSFGDAIRKVAPGIESLKDQLNAMGVGGGDAFDFLNQQVDLFTGEVTGPALQSIEGYAQGLVGLNNAGQLNQDTFAGITEQIGKTEQALESQGVNGRALLTAMQSPLQKMWELEQKFGYTTDASTQALIDQAKEQGLVGDKFKPVAEQMLDATNRIADAVEGLAEVFGVLPKAAKDAASGISDELGKIKTPTIKIPVTTDITYDFHDPAVPTDSGIVYAHGGKVKPYYMAVGGGPVGTDTVPAWLTPGEGVITKTGMTALDALNTGRLDLALQPIQSMIADDFRDFGSKALAAIHQSSGISGPVLGGGSIGVATPTTTITSGSKTIILQEQFTFNVTNQNLDTQGLDEYVEKKFMPRIMTQIEDRRRGFTGRLRRALELPIT